MKNAVRPGEKLKIILKDLQTHSKSQQELIGFVWPPWNSRSYHKMSHGLYPQRCCYISCPCRNTCTWQTRHFRNIHFWDSHGRTEILNLLVLCLKWHGKWLMTKQIFYKFYMSKTEKIILFELLWIEGNILHIYIHIWIFWKE